MDKETRTPVVNVEFEIVVTRKYHSGVRVSHPARHTYVEDIISGTETTTLAFNTASGVEISTVRDRVRRIMEELKP